MPRDNGGRRTGTERSVCLLLPPHVPQWAAARPGLEAVGSTAPVLHVLGVDPGAGEGGMGCFRGPGFRARV